jgi:hypothetical protein
LKEGALWSHVEHLKYRERKSVLKFVTNILDDLAAKGVLERRREPQSIGYGDEIGFDYVHPMPRRLKLSPLQREIMATLEEAGAETIGTVVATVKAASQDEFSGQVEGLLKLGLIRKEESASNGGAAKINLVLTEQGKAALRM